MKKSETPERQSRFNANGESIQSFPVGKKNTINSNNKHQNVFDDTAYATSGDTSRRRSNSRSSKTRRTSLSPNSRRYHKSKMYKGHKMSPTRWMRKFKTKNERSSQSSHSKQGSKMSNNNSNDDNSIITPTNAIVGIEFDDIYSQSNIENLDDFNDDDESICTHSTTEYDPSSRRLTTIVWKRKSGFTSLIKSGYVRASEKANTLGHSTVTNLQKLIKVSHQNNDVSSSTQYEPPSNIKMWERRRIVLEGGILMYFHEDADVNTFDEDESPRNNNDDDEMEKENSNFTASQSDIFFTKHRNLSKFKNKLIEFSHAATHNAIFSLHPNESNEHYKALYKSAINTPRGLIDLVATRAAASVTHYGPSSFAPTPYSLSIILNQTNKWEICFQTSKELLTWLGALTDISLKHSIDSFRYDHGYSYCSAEYDVTPSGSFHDSVSKSGETSFDNDEFIDDNGERDGRLEVSNTHEGRNLFSNSGVLLPSILSTKKKVVRFDSNGIAAGSSQDSYTKMAIVNGAMLIFSILWTDTISTYSILVAQTFINGIAWYYVYTSYRERVSFVDKRGSEHTETEKEIGLETTQAIQSSIMTTPNQQLNRGGSFRDDVSFSLDKSSFLDEKPFYMPQAGESTLKLKDITDAKNIKDRPVGWISALSSSIQLRGAGYLFNKKKVPSPSSLYELIQVDAFDSDVHMLDVGRRFQLPEVHFKSQHGNWRAPNLLVISFALPTSAPKLGKASDGKGYIVVGYYRMRNETRKVLEIISNHKYNTDDQNTKLMQLFPNECDRQIINGVKLWEKWCQCAPSDQEMQKRLKFIPRGDNLKEIGVPSWICKYNGKPMLIKRPGETNFVYSHPDQNMMEIDINMHPLPYMFRQAMTYLKDYYFQQMIMTFAFVIEGRDEDELPEVLLGNPLQLPFVDPKNVITSESVFRSK